MTAFSRIAWVCSLWVVWFTSSVEPVVVVLIVSAGVWVTMVRPTAREIAGVLVLALIFVVQVYLLYLIAGVFGADIAHASTASAVAGMKIGVLLLAVPLFSRGTLMDDLLLATARLPMPARTKHGWSLRCVPALVLMSVAVLVAPILSIPREYRSIRRAQRLRGVMPDRLTQHLKMIWRRPSFYVWTLHVEPLLVRQIEAIPRLVDALALKGYRRKERVEWMRIPFEWGSLVYLCGAVSNIVIASVWVP